MTERPQFVFKPETGYTSGPEEERKRLVYWKPIDIAKALDSHVLNNIDLVLLNLPLDKKVATLKRAELENIVAKLNEPIVEDRLNNVPDNYPNEEQPTVKVLAGIVYSSTDKRIRGTEARQTAKALLRHLIKAEFRPKATEFEPIPDNHVLEFTDLDDLMELVENGLSDKQESVAKQLIHRDIFALSTEGIAVKHDRSPHASEEKGFKLPQELLSIIKKLENPESATVLEQWIYDKLVDQPEDAISLFQVLVQFTTFLDSEAYISLWKESWGENKGEIPLQPFRSLYIGVTSAIEFLKQVDINTLDLENVRDLIVIRYKQVLEGVYKGFDQGDAQIALTPSMEMLAFRLLDNDQYKEGGLYTPEQAAVHIVNLLEQTAASTKDVLEFYQHLKYYAGRKTDIVDAFVEEVVRSGLINKNHNLPDYDFGTLLDQITREDTNKIIHSFIDFPWVDAFEEKFDFSTIITDPEVNVVKLCLVPGTFGPMTQGHLAYIRRLLNYIRYEEQNAKARGDKELGLIVIVPTPSILQLPNFPKTFEEVGTVEDRLGGIFLTLSALSNKEREKILITSLGQPDPNRVKEINGRLNGTFINLLRKIQDDLAAHKRVTEFDVEKVVAAGSDEVQRKKEGDALKGLVASQPRKLKNPSVIVTRSYEKGDMVSLIQSSHELMMYTMSDVVLAPGARKKGSSKSRVDLLKGNALGFPPALRPFLLDRWGLSAYRERVKEQKEGLLSVTEVQKQLIEDFRKLNQKHVR